MTAAEAEELQRLSQENSAFLMEAICMKFTPAMTKVVELISSGAIGEPRLIQAGAGFPVPPNGPLATGSPNWAAGLSTTSVCTHSP